MPWQDVLDTCCAVTGSDAEVVWVDGDFLLEQGVEQWMGLPMWVREEELLGIHMASISRAIDAGLDFRPLEDTIRATLEEADTTEAAGLSPEREAELLAAWKAR